MQSYAGGGFTETPLNLPVEAVNFAVSDYHHGSVITDYKPTFGNEAKVLRAIEILSGSKTDALRAIEDRSLH